MIQRPICDVCGEFTDDDGDCGDCANCHAALCTHSDRYGRDGNGNTCPNRACGLPNGPSTTCDDTMGHDGLCRPPTPDTRDAVLLAFDATLAWAKGRDISVGDDEDAWNARCAAILARCEALGWNWEEQDDLVNYCLKAAPEEAFEATRVDFARAPLKGTP